MDQVLWITEVLSEVEVETSIEEVSGALAVLEVLEAEVQVDLALGVVIVGVTKTNVGGSKQDKNSPDLLFSSIFQFKSMSSTIAINDTPISCKFLEKFTFHSFFFLQFNVYYN